LIHLGKDSRPVCLKRFGPKYPTSWDTISSPGQVTDCIPPIQAALDGFLELGDFDGASKTAGNLSESWLFCGKIAESLNYARKSVEFSEKTDNFGRYSKLTTLGDVLHYTGSFAEALEAFKRAQALKLENRPDEPFLESIWGYRYCDLLLSMGEFEVVRHRALSQLEGSKANEISYDVALAQLALGRACSGLGDSELAIRSLDDSVERLRSLGNQAMLAKALLARCRHWRLSNRLREAARDLRDCRKTCQFGGISLLLSNCDLSKHKSVLLKESSKPLSSQ
jgi:tetratricopeptide (TPR) repeat protein